MYACSWVASCAGPRPGNRVGCLHDRRDQVCHFDLVVVCSDGVTYLFRFLVSLAVFHSDDGVRSIHGIHNDLSYVVQQSCSACCVRFQADFRGHG